MASALTWYILTPPRDVDLDGLTAALRPLASRPRPGMFSAPVPVVFELWSNGGEVYWRLGIPHEYAGEISGQLRAHLPMLSLTIDRSKSPSLLLGAELRLDEAEAPLRTDVAEPIAMQLHSHLTNIAADEAAVLQFVVGPNVSRSPRQEVPERFTVAGLLGISTAGRTTVKPERDRRVKVAEPLFAVHGRIGAMAGTATRAAQLVRGVGSALRLANAEHAGLKLTRSRGGIVSRIDDPTGSSWSSCTLNAAELACLLGWPTQADVPDALPTSGGHISPVPAGLLAERDGRQRILGISLHPSQAGQLVYMPEMTALHHSHIIGPTGSGKSTLLTGLIASDIAAGRGCLVVEPRGDLIEDVLAQIPKERSNDVVVIDPADVSRVVGINVLHGPLETAERRADELVGLLAGMHGSNFGPRTSDIALHAILTAARLGDGTLCDILPLLSQPEFLRRTLSRVNDPLVLGPWWSWFSNLSEGERSNITAPLANKLRGFISRAGIRRMVGQSKPMFSFDDLFSKRRIVLVNLNRGVLGAPTANLLGALVLSQVWSALQRRASIPREQRSAVGLYVDEFQDYVGITGGLDFGDALAQSRGLGGAWTLAHQHMGQLSSTLDDALISNARSRVVFHPATTDAKALAAALGGRLTGDDLLRLGAYQACCSLHVDKAASRPFTIRTRAPQAAISDGQALRAWSAERYGVNGEEIDLALAARWSGEDHAPDGPVGVRKRRAS